MTGFQKVIKVAAIIFGTYISVIIISVISIVVISILGTFVAISNYDNKEYYEDKNDDYYDVREHDLFDEYYKEFTNQL